jgi:hypothetical protein
MFRLVSVLMAAAVFGVNAEAAVRVYRPTEPSQVVLQLGSSSNEQRLAQLRSASSEAPGDVDALLRYVDALIEAGARSGNERYYGYAEQAVGAVPDQSSPAITLRRARLLQHRHEFRDAERLLGQILEANWRDREARLMRAQVRLHLHEPQSTLKDCAALTPFVDMLTSATCVAQAHAALGDLQRAYELILRALQAEQGEAATRSWSAGVAAEFAVRLGDSSAASQWYRESFKLDPDSHYARITYADWLLSTGSFEEALQVSRRGASLADRARSVLAARDPRSIESRRLQLAWQEAAARGERAHLRDQARFELTLLHDARKAHATALANFNEHNEADDALILAATAAATHDRAAAQAIEAWRHQYRYQDARLDRLLGAVL